MVAPLTSARLRRTWPQRLLIIFNLLCIVAALGAAVTIGYLNKSVSDIPRIRLGDALRSTKGTAAGKPQNYLIVGVDSAAGLAPGDPVRIGRPGGLRSDTIMVLRVDPESTTAQLVSFPRDLWVDIAGKGSKNRINTAIETSDPEEGPKRLIRTIEKDFQVPINHYLQIDFAGFQKIVRTVGGVPIYFDKPARDKHSRLYVPDAGCVTLDENSALAYARSRYYQVFENGRWHEDPSYDLGRISRQQDFIKRVIKQAIAKGVRNPTKLRSMLDVGVNSVASDTSLSIGDLTDLGLRFRGFNPDNLKTFSLPVVPAYHGAAFAADLQPEAAAPILRIFQGVGPTRLAPATVKVKVFNGSQRANQASVVSRALGEAGFQVESPDDAAVRPAKTLVRYAHGRQDAAQLVARYVGVPVQFEEASEVTDVELVTAADFTAILRNPKPASAVPRPSTSVMTASTTTSTTTTGGSSRTTTPKAATTTSTTVPGIVPPPPPAAVTCG